MSDEKEILIHPLSLSVSCLIPKKRGTGFLRTPWGHHQDQNLADIAIELGCDIYGLDGSLDIQTGYGGSKRIEEIGQLLSLHYGFPWRVARHDEFFDKHPTRPIIKDS